MHSTRKACTKFLQNWIRKSALALVILVKLFFSNSCISPISPALYVRCECLQLTNQIACFYLAMLHNNRQCWQAPDVPAELAKRVICACIREIYFFRDFMGLKGQNVFGHFWLGIFIQDNLRVNLKQEV